MDANVVDYSFEKGDCVKLSDETRDGIKIESVLVCRSMIHAISDVMHI